MNQFIFCAIVDGQIQYGTMQAQGGMHARHQLEARYKGRVLQKLEIKGVASKTFDFDVVGGLYIPAERGPIIKLPITPKRMQQMLQRILDDNPGATVTQLAERIHRSPDWVSRVLADPSFMNEDFEDSVQCCVRANPAYTEGEIRKILEKDQ